MATMKLSEQQASVVRAVMCVRDPKEKNVVYDPPEIEQVAALYPWRTEVLDRDTRVKFATQAMLSGKNASKFKFGMASSPEEPRPSAPTPKLKRPNNSCKNEGKSFDELKFSSGVSKEEAAGGTTTSPPTIEEVEIPPDARVDPLHPNQSLNQLLNPLLCLQSPRPPVRLKVDNTGTTHAEEYEAYVPPDGAADRRKHALRRAHRAGRQPAVAS